MSYKSYQKSRDAAWEILIRHGVSSLPVSLAPICRAEEIRVMSYKRAESILRELGVLNFEDGNDAFTFGRMIFYDESRPNGRIRFSLAHELGHIFLHDTSAGTRYNREPDPHDDPIETEANLFAARLLAPAIVLHDVRAYEPEEIADLCRISLQAARFRAERLQQLEARNRAFLQTRGYPCFGLSPLERQVEKQFGGYIAWRRKATNQDF